jgi:hypothetical protein
MMMKKLYLCCLFSCLWLPAQAQQANVISSCGLVTLTGTQSGLFVDTKGNLCTNGPPLPSGTTGIQGNGSGTTGAVVGTLAAAAAKTTYICDFDVSATGTGSVGPITIAGLLGGSKVYQLTAPGSVAKTFSPCLPGSAVNTAITITTTADPSATAVNVNSSGFQQ